MDRSRNAMEKLKECCNLLAEKFNQCCNFLGSKQDACIGHLVKFRVFFSWDVFCWEAAGALPTSAGKIESRRLGGSIECLNSSLYDPKLAVLFDYFAKC